MGTINLLYKDEYKINDKISVVIPDVGYVVDHEDEYYGLVNVFTAMPIDMMVQLDEIGIDFTSINEYELFLLLSNGLKDADVSKVVKGIDFSKFELAVREDNDTVALVNKEDDVVIDRAIHDKIAMVLRKIHHLEKNTRKPANKEAKEFMLERAKAKARRKKRSVSESQIEPLIISLVNTEQFKYDYESVKKLSIYQFNESVRQIINKIEYDNRMIGVYAGTVSVKDLSQDDLNWLSHK